MGGDARDGEGEAEGGGHHGLAVLAVCSRLHLLSDTSQT